MKKRILHLLSSNKYSGAENVVINMINTMSDEYDLVYASPRGPIEEILKKRDINYIPLTNMNPIYLNSILKMWKPDIIHAHDFRASINSIISLYSCIKISQLHHNPKWIRSLNLYTLTYISTCLFYKKIVVVSQEILDEAIFSKFIKRKSYLLKNNVDIREIENRLLSGDSIQTFDIAFVGRLTKVKNPLRFIEIVYKISRKKSDIKVIMIGDGNLREECVNKIKELDIEENIFMSGFLENPFLMLNKSKILVMTSLWEGFGLVAVEAMSLGKPVISTPVGGLKNIIKENCGFLCISDEEFILKINEILENKELYFSMSTHCKKEAINYGDQEKWKNEIRDLYNENS